MLIDYSSAFSHTHTHTHSSYRFDHFWPPIVSPFLIEGDVCTKRSNLDAQIENVAKKKKSSSTLPSIFLRFRILLSSLMVFRATNRSQDSLNDPNRLICFLFRVHTEISNMLVFRRAHFFSFFFVSNRSPALSNHLWTAINCLLHHHRHHLHRFALFLIQPSSSNRLDCSPPAHFFPSSIILHSLSWLIVFPNAIRTCFGHISPRLLSTLNMHSLWFVIHSHDFVCHFWTSDHRWSSAHLTLNSRCRFRCTSISEQQLSLLLSICCREESVARRRRRAHSPAHRIGCTFVFNYDGRSQTNDSPAVTWLLPVPCSAHIDMHRF